MNRNERVERMVTVHHGDCLDVLRELAADSVDSIVTDPPYGIGFMGKEWDHGVPGVAYWAEAMRVAKPGAHLLAFGGTRTFHRLACAIEDAGWEIRDTVMWVYGSGFPKSLDVSKAIDKAAGAEREVVGTNPSYRAHDAARQWAGWGTALKPAYEPVIVARKPLVGTVSENVLRYGTGGLNVDGCRVSWPNGKMPKIGTPEWGGPNKKSTAIPLQDGKTVRRIGPSTQGRWPANMIHDGSAEVVGMFPVTKSGKPGTMRKGENNGAAYGAESRLPGTPMTGFGDSGSASRFFYCAKASRAERGGDNKHPTVKPMALMRYLCRLVTPPGGTVLDPFAGSGTTGLAASQEGFRSVLIELEEEYVGLIRQRCGLFVGAQVP